MPEAVEDVMRHRAAHGFRDALFEPVDEIGANRGAVQRGGGEPARLIVIVDIGIGRIARIPRHLSRRQIAEAAHIAARRDRVDAVGGSKRRVRIGRAAHHARGAVAHAVTKRTFVANTNLFFAENLLANQKNQNQYDRNRRLGAYPQMRLSVIKPFEF